ncbi:MAG: hypothetical protein ACN6O8_20275 [Achromobacter sp.]|uniref:hypothetical protein n=1 Tax=Achromobacter sp. TaxID=134375 RepID=UPI003D089C4A
MKKGDWIAGGGKYMPNIGRVKEVHSDGLIDIVFYGRDGTKLGRLSPAMGGPRHFDPCCSPVGWQLIQKPEFPLHGYIWGDKLTYLDDAAQPAQQGAGE